VEAKEKIKVLEDTLALPGGNPRWAIGQERKIVKLINI